MTTHCNMQFLESQLTAAAEVEKVLKESVIAKAKVQLDKVKKRLMNQLAKVCK